jgi:diguanylate cyclase (GGDEF)-like protein
MMVDDEPITMQVIKAFLEESGYQRFHLVEDSRRAMQVLEESPPDVLLLDLLMPEVSGFDILAQIRQHRRLEHLPVLVLTAKADTQTKLHVLSLGATDFLAKPVDPSELALRVRNTLAAKAYQDQLAYYDSLTRLPNRRLFLEILDWSIKRTQRDGRHMLLLNLELDNFNQLRDSLGITVIDEILLEIARRIEDLVRDSDQLSLITGSDAERVDLSRFDSSVFILLLHAIEHVENGAVIARRINDAIKQPIQMQGRSVCLTASLGIAAFPGDGHDSQTLLKLAASAKGFAQQRGGDGFEFARQEISDRYERRLQLETRLRQAIEGEELELHYQPQVEVSTGNLLGFEALLHWHTEDLGCVLPETFIPLAEETGLIVPLGEWVLAEATRVLLIWQQTYHERLTMAVNLSARQFRDSQLLEQIGSLINSSSLNPASLTMELTESLLIDDFDRSVATLSAIKELGCQLSLDDFGTGYSSLSYLQRLPMDELKIAHPFINALDTSPNSRAITASVIFLGHHLGLKVVAEGVETPGQLEFLQRSGCDHYQGFLFSRPRSRAQIEDLLAHRTRHGHWGSAGSDNALSP